MAQNSFCEKCKEYNCSKHSTYTQRLQSLLEYFEPSDEEMRTYIEPDKAKASQKPTNSLPSSRYEHGEKNSFDRHDPRLRVATSSSNDDEAAKDMANPEHVTMMPKSDAVTSTAIVHVGGNSGNSATSATLPSNDGITKLSGGKYRAHEKHHWIKINASSFVSCAAPGGVYSEIAFVLWVNNKYYSKFPNDRYRVVLSLMYDSEDDLWSLSAKLLKRASYHAKDEEEGQISNRLCITSELRSEIKKMLLYLGISPREAYRMFRKNLCETFVISESEIGFTTVECASHAALLKDLDKPVTASTGWESDYHRHYNQGQYCNSVMRHNGATQNPKYAHALVGYPTDVDCYG